MGSKTNNPKRSGADFYPTPTSLVKKGIDLAIERYQKTHGSAVVDLQKLRFLDPGCGPDVRFAMEAFKRGFCSLGVDTCDRSDGLPKGIGYCFGTDFLGNKIMDSNFTWANDMDQFDIICGNPPFSSAEQFVRRSLDLLEPDGVLCFLLRVGFWESGKRIKFYNDPRNKPAETWILQQRPSFRNDSGVGPTDGTAYAFFIWDGEMVNSVLRGHGVRPVVDVISWR